MKEVPGQISLFDLNWQCVARSKVTSCRPGDCVEENCLGDRVSFDDIEQMVGQMIIIDISTRDHVWYKVVLIEKIFTHSTGKRSLIYYDGTKQRGMINEMYFNNEMPWLAKAWKVRK